MKKTIQLISKCTLLEEMLQKTDESFLLKYATKKHLFQIYSKEDLDNLKRHVSNVSSPLLLSHLDQLEIEENPVLRKIASMWREIIQGDFFKIYKKIALGINANPQAKIELNEIDLQNETILEQINNHCTHLQNHTKATSTNSQELAKSLELYRLYTNIDDDITFNQKQHHKLQAIINHMHITPKPYSTIQNNIEHFYNQARNLPESASEESHEKLLQEARDLHDKLSKLYNTTDEIKKVQYNLSLILERIHTEQELRNSYKQIVNYMQNKYQVNIEGPANFRYETTSIPKHDIILEDNVVKFQITRNTKLENIQTLTDQNLIQQRNYLMAITHDPSFPKRHPDFDFDQALDNLAQNINMKYKASSQPEWVKHCIDNIPNMKAIYSDSKERIDRQTRKQQELNTTSIYD